MSKILDPVALWQDLHQIPELAMQEVKTSAYVAKTLEDLGIPVTWAARAWSATSAAKNPVRF